MPPRLTLSLIFRVTSPAPRMMPAAAGTRLLVLPKSTRLLTQIFAPSTAIMP